MDDKGSVSFIHFSDTHIGDNKSFHLYNRNTFKASERLIEHINETGTTADFVIHSGDIVNNPDDDSIQLAKSLFSKLNKPSYFINGNHDTPSIVESLQTGFSESISDAGTSRFFTLNNFIFLMLDTQGPGEIDPHGEFSEKQEKALSDFLNDAIGRKIVLFCHFPPLPIGSPWVDRDMLMINGERLHNLLVQSKAGIQGVFFGHIHHHLTELHDGILYASAPSPFSRFSILPTDQQVRIESDVPISFNYVRISENSVSVKLIAIEENRH
jgi:Icc protein